MIGIMLVIVILKTAMSKTGATMIGILVLEMAGIGTVTEVLDVIEIGQALTTALAEEDDSLPTSIIEIQMYIYQ